MTLGKGGVPIWDKNSLNPQTIFFSIEFGYKLSLSEKSSFCPFLCILFAQSYHFLPVADFTCHLLPGSKMSENGLKIVEDNLTAEK